MAQNNRQHGLLIYYFILPCVFLNLASARKNMHALAPCYLSARARRSNIAINQSTSTEIECTYLENRSMLSCLTPAANIIDCETFGLFEKYESNYLNVFGISAARPTGNDQFMPASVTFELYAQLTDGLTWLNSTFFDSIYGDLKYSLYYATNTLNHGFRVRDRTCFDQLVQAFNGITYRHTIQINNGHQAEILGSILVLKHLKNC